MNQNHKIGDEVIALSSADRPNQPRIKGRHYTITSVYFCSATGRQLVNIDYTKSMTCVMKCGCGKKHHTGDHYAYTYADRFVKPEDVEARMHLAVAEEDYDTATTCRDLLNKMVPADE
jgi:hypothetical protein